MRGIAGNSSNYVMFELSSVNLISILFKCVRMSPSAVPLLVLIYISNRRVRTYLIDYKTVTCCYFNLYHYPQKNLPRDLNVIIRNIAVFFVFFCFFFEKRDFHLIVSYKLKMIIAFLSNNIVIFSRENFVLK